MSTLIVQFTTQDGNLIDIVSAAVDISVPNPDKILSDLINIMLESIEKYSILLVGMTDPLIKSTTHAMLVETLNELKQDVTNLHKIVAICYLLRSLENDEPLQAIKLTIDKHVHIHNFVLNTIPSNVYVASTIRS